MKFLFSYILFCFTLCCSAQGFRSRLYVSQSSGSSTKAIFEKAPGKYIATGFIIDTSSGVPIKRIAIIELDSTGKLKWIKKYGDSQRPFLGNGFIQRCFYKQSNNLYYAGCTIDTNNQQIGVFMKFNLNGDTLWRRFYRSSDSLEDVIPQMVTGSTDGGFLITGFFQHWGLHTNKFLLIKTDAAGNELWRKKLGK
jgi:hypothetical protein